MTHTALATTLLTTLAADVDGESGGVSVRRLQRLLPDVTDVALRRELARLTKAGILTKTIRQEYERARGARRGFGGTAVCVRTRAYYTVNQESR